MTIHDKYRVLQENLKALGSVAVAFSSGVDSTFLLKVAHDVLGDKDRGYGEFLFFPEERIRRSKSIL